MAEPLKHLYTRELLSALASEVQGAYPALDSAAFLSAVLDEQWQLRELKSRMAHIAHCLHDNLPDEYPVALDILKRASLNFSGFEYMFFPAYVEFYGLQDYAHSVPALAFFTPRASAEFAVRPFIQQYGEKMMSQMLGWADSENHHVRRLASEGCRPRLPWAMALPEFKQDPAPILPILDKLKQDGSEYVRRSVANNLNDISKDHPAWVIELSQSWYGRSEQLNHLLKHALRGLLKQGHPEALALFDFHPPEHVCIDDVSVQRAVMMGENLAFSFTLNSQKGALGKLRIEYAIDFLRKNGRRNRKVFKLAESGYRGAEKMFHKIHSFRPISTREYYPGEQGLVIIVNGHELASHTFELRDHG